MPLVALVDVAATVDQQVMGQSVVTGPEMWVHLRKEHGRALTAHVEQET